MKPLPVLLTQNTFVFRLTFITKYHANIRANWRSDDFHHPGHHHYLSFFCLLSFTAEEVFYKNQNRIIWRRRNRLQNRTRSSVPSWNFLRKVFFFFFFFKKKRLFPPPPLLLLMVFLSDTIRPLRIVIDWVWSVTELHARLICLIRLDKKTLQ